MWFDNSLEQGKFDIYRVVAPMLKGNQKRLPFLFKKGEGDFSCLSFYVDIKLFIVRSKCLFNIGRYVVVMVGIFINV